MAIEQGDIYWVALDVPSGSEPGIIHPHVVIQDNVLEDVLTGTVLQE